MKRLKTIIAFILCWTFLSATFHPLIEACEMANADTPKEMSGMSCCPGEKTASTEEKGPECSHCELSKPKDKSSESATKGDAAKNAPLWKRIQIKGHGVINSVFSFNFNSVQDNQSHRLKRSVQLNC